MTIPGSLDPCRKCGALVRVPMPKEPHESDGVPAWKVTGSKRSRGFFCPRCASVLGGLRSPRSK